MSVNEVTNASFSFLLVMGVSGVGKTTVGVLLAASLGWEFADADSFHPPGNVEKLTSGIPLTDEDRLPWLQSIAAWIDSSRSSGRCGVVACSALKRSYRDLIIGGRKGVRLVYLKGDEKLIRTRISKRSGHFVSATLLQSQLNTLEEPGLDERPIVISIDADPHEIVSVILSTLRQDTAP